MKSTKKTCDGLWALAVKARAGHKCEFCGRPDTLNSHHVFSRSKSSTRHDVDNGVCLCVAHHTFSSGFSAHKTPVEFIEWLKERRGEAWYLRLRLRANQIYKPDFKLIHLELQQILEKYQKTA